MSPGQFSVIADRSRSLDVKPQVPERLTCGTNEERLERLDVSQTRQATYRRPITCATCQATSSCPEYSFPFRKQSYRSLTN